MHEYTITILIMLLILLLAISSFIDLKEKIIPNGIVVLILIIGFNFNYLNNNEIWLRSSINGIATGMILTLPIYILNGLGAGDVKLISAIGSFTGANDVFLIVQMTYIINFLLALTLIIYSGDFIKMLNGFYKFFIALSKKGICDKNPEKYSSANFEMPLAPIISSSTLFLLYLRFLTN